MAVVADVERCAAGVWACDEEAVRAIEGGVECTLKWWMYCFRWCSVGAVDAVGEACDPELHQAMSRQ